MNIYSLKNCHSGSDLFAYAKQPERATPTLRGRDRQYQQPQAGHGCQISFEDERQGQGLRCCGWGTF